MIERGYWCILVGRRNQRAGTEVCSGREVETRLSCRRRRIRALRRERSRMIVPFAVKHSAILYLPCSHQYCSECLKTWRSSSLNMLTCPKCRAPSIPPTREMIQQRNTLKIALDALDVDLEKHHDSLDPHSDRQKYLFEDFAYPADFEKWSKDEQQAYLRSYLEEKKQELTEVKMKLDRQIGDFASDQVIESAREKRDIVDELPGELSIAAAQNRVDVVVNWLGGEPPFPKERINARNPNRMDRTLLHEASTSGHGQLMKLLLCNGATVDPASYSALPGNESPFSFACENKDDLAARILLQWGCQVDGESLGVPFPVLAKKADNSALAKLIQTPLGGRRCEIVGLLKRKDLNGWRVVVEKYLPGQDRYVVCLEHFKERMKASPSNLKRVDRTPSDPGYSVRFGPVNGFLSFQ